MPPAFGSDIEISTGDFHDQFPSELVERGRSEKEQQPFGGAGVDVLHQHLQTDATVVDFSGRLDDPGQRIGDPREFPDDERIPFAQVFQRRFQMWAIPVGAEGFFRANLLAPRSPQGILLQCGILMVETRA